MAAPAGTRLMPWLERATAAMMWPKTQTAQLESWAATPKRSTSCWNGRPEGESLVSDDTPPEQEDQQEQYRDIVSFHVRVPAKIVNNAKKVISHLMIPGLPDLKELFHTSLQEKIARRRLSIAELHQKIRQIEPEPGALQAGLTHMADDQQRVDRVTLKALHQVNENHQQEHPPPDAEEEISTSWLRRFRKEVEGLGDDDMEAVFARILANEIEQPNSFSLQTLRVLGTLDQRTAQAFRTAGSIALLIYEPLGVLRHARLHSPYDKLAVNNGLQPYNLSYETLLRLVENGLVSGDFHSELAHPLSRDKSFLFRCQRILWKVTCPSDYEGKILFSLPGLEFTQVGRELLRIVDLEPHPEFIDALSKSFAERFPIIRMEAVG